MRRVSVTMATASKGTTIYLLTILLGLFSINTEAQQARWSDCSRTCGGGVKHILNGCLQFGPNSECLSYNKSYISCNLQPCAATEPDFRTSQCQKYNRKMFSGTYHDWIPYFHENQCELYCQAKGTKFYYRHAERVVDGTPCGYDSTGICIEGACTPVGCDMNLGSEKRYDSCMVCDGDGSTCKKFEQKGELSKITTGYSTLFTLPKGSTSVRIEKTKGSNKIFLAVTDAKGNFLLNGNYAVAASKMLILGGAVFNYSRPDSGLESLRAFGPTHEDLIIKIVVTSTARHFVNFEYYAPYESSHVLEMNRDFRVDTDQASKNLGHREIRPFTISNNGIPSFFPHSGDHLDKNFKLLYGIDDDEEEYEEEDDETTVGGQDGEDEEDKLSTLSTESIDNAYTTTDDTDTDDDHDDDSGSADDISHESSPVASRQTTVSPHKPGSESGSTSTGVQTNISGVLVVEGDVIEKEKGGWHAIETPEGKITVNSSANFSVHSFEESSLFNISIDTRGTGHVEVIDRSAEVEENEIGSYLPVGNSTESQLRKADDVDAESSGEGATESIDREFSGKEKQTKDKDEPKVTKTTEKWIETTTEVDSQDEDKNSGSSATGDTEGSEDGDESSAAEDKPTTPVITTVSHTRTSTITIPAASSSVRISSVTTATVRMLDSSGKKDDDDDDYDYDDDKTTSPVTSMSTTTSTSTVSPATKRADLPGKKDEKEDKGDADDDDKEETDDDDKEETVVKKDVKKVEKDDTSEGSAAESGKGGSSGDGGIDDSEDDDYDPEELSSTHTARTPASKDGVIDDSEDKEYVSEIVTTSYPEVTTATKTTETVTVTELTKATEPSTATMSAKITTPKKVTKPTKRTRTHSVTAGSGKMNESGDDDDDEYKEGSAEEESGDKEYEPDDSDDKDDDVTTTMSAVSTITEETVTGESEDEDVASSSSTLMRRTTTAAIEVEVTTVKKETTPAAAVTEKREEDETVEEKVKEMEEKERREKEKKEKEKKEKEEKEKKEKEEKEKKEKEKEEKEKEEKKTEKDMTTAAPDQTFTPLPITPPKDEKEEDIDKEPGEDVTTEFLGLLTNETIVAEIAATVQVPAVIEPAEVCPDVEHDFSRFKEVIVREKYTRWHVGKWTACENGLHEREILCLVHDDYENVTITENQKRCSQPKPATIQRCHGDYIEPDQTIVDRTTARSCVGDVCQEFEWVVSDWFGCSRSCEEELDSRLVFCATKSGPYNRHFTVSEDHCRLLDKPIDKRECQRQEIACEMKPKWFATQWGECSSKCGIGTQVRHIFCGRIHRQMVGDTVVITHPESCDQETKLESVQFCKTECSARWVTGPFGECPVSCGGGVQVRQVVCLQGHVLSNDCDVNNKPHATHDCNYHTCPAACPVIRCDLRCPHGYSADNNGCEICQCSELPQVFPELPCATSTYGCCPDGVTSARGYGPDRCKQSDPWSHGLCIESMFGCCPDGVTSATGYHYAGCEEKTRRTDLTGATMCSESEEGSGEITCTKPSREVIKCQETQFGCCPDGVTVATGSLFEGCEGIVDCRHQTYGCCADGYTAAQGPDRFGCPEYVPPRQHVPQRPCNEHFYGCCLDGIGAAVGPNFEGCDEHNTTTHLTFKVDCTDTEYGCCLDGKTPAGGPHHAGCPHQHRRGGICYLPAEAGTCSNHAIKWYYDPNLGDCQRFWYSGCGTNGNLFESEEDCRAVCITPPDHDKCFLPKVTGRCRDAMPRYFYNADIQSCESFSYSGCDGNKNNFESIQSCDLQCTHPLKHNVCNLPAVKGPCRGSFIHWYYDAHSKHCQQFYYGGCLGNENRFETYEECNSRCMAPIGDLCSLEPDAGPCHSVIPVWHFNSTTDSCERFYYGGCRGNLNRFTTRQKCQDTCLLPKKESTNICHMPHDVGLCSGYFEKWYHDPNDGFCKKFIYSGCGGSLNRFDSEPECRTSCSAREPVVDDVCSLDWDTGPCTDYVLMYYFNKEFQVCDRFYYGGCVGNMNKYQTEEECLKRCVHLTPTEHPRHVETSTVEVPRKCSQPPEHGPCRKSLARWHYDQASMACTMFQYGGCEGNGNRFMSEAICLRSCHPGYVSDRSFDYSAGTETEEEDRFIGETPDGSIEIGQGHVQTETGVTHDVTDEEISSVTHSAGVYHMCHQASDAGTCYEWEVMWFYSAENAQCQQFWYGGCGGNDNRFSSAEECSKRCITSSSPQAPHPEPPYHGEGHSREAGVAEETGSVCSQPSNSGPCSDYVIKWYYNEEAQQCVQFYYGGCEGNRNRFETMEECEAACKPVVATERPKVEIGDFCHQPVETGQCNSKELKYYWDSTEEQCRPFYYTGCQGNQNNFDTSEHCYNLCGLNVKEEHRLAYTKESCYQPREAGPCYDYVVRYYFDTEENDCRGFYYGGCKGNHNSFHSYEDCHAICMPQPAAHVCPPAEPCDRYSCQGEIRYVRDEHGCERCQCDHSVVAAPTLDVGRQEYNLKEEAVFTCYGHIEPGNAVSIVRDEELVTSIQADQHGFVKFQFMIEKSGAYRCVVHLTNGYTVQSQDSFVEVRQPDSRSWPNGNSNGHSFSSGNRKPYLDDHRSSHTTHIQVGLTANGQWFNVGDDIIITCTVTGLPRDEEVTITWAKDNEEILVQMERIPDDGIFQIKIEKAESADTGSYKCHVAINSGLVIESPSLYIPPLYNNRNTLNLEISKTQMGMEYSALCHGNLGSGVQVWLRMDNQDVAVAEMSADGRAILKFEPRQSGYYRCVANVGHQTIESEPVYVSAFEGSANIQALTARNIGVELSSSRTEYVEGSSVLFTCKILGIEDYSRGFQAVFKHFNARGDVLLKEFHSKQEGTEHLLTLEDMSEREAGRYTCEAFPSDQRGQSYYSNAVDITYRINIAVDEECVDKPWYAECEQVVVAQFCRHDYFKKFCCRSCRDAGLI